MDQEIDDYLDDQLKQYCSRVYKKQFEDNYALKLDEAIERIEENNVCIECADLHDDTLSSSELNKNLETDKSLSEISIKSDELLRSISSEDDLDDEYLKNSKFNERFSESNKVMDSKHDIDESQRLKHKDSIMIICEKFVRDRADIELTESSRNFRKNQVKNDIDKVKIPNQCDLNRQRASINIPSNSYCDVWKSDNLAGYELHLSDTEDVDSKIIKRKFNTQSKAMSKFQLCLSDTYKKLKNIYGKEDVEEENKKKPVIKLTEKQLRDFKEKIDIVRNIRIDSRPIDLPSLGHLVFPFLPYNHNYPTECYEAFSTGSLYLGTANLFGMNGHGTYIFPNGATYQGQFKDNMFHGFGRMKYPNNSIVEGIWYNGNLVEPKVYFNDGIYYDPDEWDYLQFPDRRYLSEKHRGLLPDNDPQLTDDHPARRLPEGCYDTGEGFYSVKTKCLHHPITGSYLRIPTTSEAKWIIDNCRCCEDYNVPFMSHMFPAQYNVLYQRHELALDRNWFYESYPPLSPHDSKTLRDEIINDFDKLRYSLTREVMMDYCVPALKLNPNYKYDQLERHRGRDLAPWVMNVPDSFALFIIDPDIVYQPGVIKPLTSLDILRRKSYKELDFNKFVLTLYKLHDFINGKNIVWNEKIEAKFLTTLKMYHHLENAIINSVLVVMKIHKRGKLNKRSIVKALKLWTEDDFPKGKLIKPKHVEVYERKLRNYKKYLVDIKNATILSSYNSSHSTTRFYPRLEMYAPGNWKMSTINKIKKERHIIIAGHSPRN